MAETGEDTTAVADVMDTPKPAAASATPSDGTPKVIKKKCKYFRTTGKCKFGNRCRFLHVPKAPKVDAEEELADKLEKVLTGDTPKPIQCPPEAQVIMPSNLRVARPVVKPTRIVLKSTDISSKIQVDARNAEIAYFKRRFTETKTVDKEDGCTAVTFQYVIMNPDWVFDVKSLEFTLLLAPEHPIACSSLELDQGIMPSPLHIYLTKKLNEMIQEKYDTDVNNDSFEPIGRWLIRTVDKHILELFIVGLKRTQWLQNAHASGIKVTVFDKPECTERKLTTLDEIAKKEDDHAESTEEQINDTEQQSNIESVQGAESSSNVKNPSADSAGRMTVVVKWADSFQSIGTICFTALSGAARCLRCGTQEFFDVTHEKQNSWRCKKCSTMQSIRCESVLGHQNSNVFAHVYPRGCRPTDCVLQGSKLKLSCGNCSKTLLVESLPYGSATTYWCRQCNSKMRFLIDSVLFQGQISTIPEGQRVARPKAPKVKKDEYAIVPGTPLPKTGTCKHYGKSFRWFRFPCCGKLYPCDTCHNEVETEHEMKLANRMVCGFCSTEQPFSKEQCNVCKGAIIKTRSSHWEGGKGCRDQKFMSKNDSRKYKNTGNKTIPAKHTGQATKKKTEVKGKNAE